MNKFLKFILALFIPFMLNAADSDYDSEIQSIKDSFVSIIQQYKEGKIDEAKTATQNAYFGHFENIEAAIRVNFTREKAYSMESKFGKIRKAIIAKKPVEEIQAIMDELSKEMDEVLPIINTGHKLVGEYSDPKNADVSETSSEAPVASQTTAQPAGGMAIEPHWQVVYNDIKTALEAAAAAYEKGDKDAAKQQINNKAKFELYRNTKLEEAIRRFISGGQGIDGDIQKRMGSAIIAINNDISADVLKSNLEELDALIYENVAKLPMDSGSLATNVVLPDSAEDDAATDFAPVVANIKAKIAEAIKTYAAKDVAKAMSDAQDVYFDEFEASGMENKVGAIDVGLKTRIEGNFGEVVALMKAGVSVERLQQAADNLGANLDAALEKTSGSSSPWALFVYAFTIILREGFEALIIVAAVVAYLLKTGNEKRMSIVYSSLGVAVVLSFVMAWIMNLIFAGAAGQKREVMEGAVMLIAVGLLFYVGFWLLSNAGAKKWSKYIQSHVSESISAGSAKALWWTVFLAVFREGAETVLFYQALIFDAKDSAGYSMIALGFVVGLIVLLVTYYVFKIFAIKIPIKPFFLVTSAIIFYMSIVFVGKGLMEFVEGKIFVPTKIDGFPTIEWLGIYPYYESLVPQAIMIAALIIGVIIMKNKQAKEA
ncbi:iron permease FTR1 family [Campylobacter rectus RM3267]|uniref:Ferrirhodotorulic acid ABC transporter, inner membrane protein n=2 Tax=Campylobacter rectus TaxID=203 RepID=A0A6G5QK53_CAMRE|nr:FTR1 family protein [Campylobacter rectus]EEF13139.1 iron permease FTR1 family [Campylobacter rectus RM3267]QCD45984.1 ferrirhodotorulic acid ABC transporter, inner membrane protein [Campylobacter rectus]UEB46703.1 FTR1 family iron permease [Campylobacter rectus]